eukprot:gene5700-7868_t
MEFEHVGVHCNAEFCHQKDFLPFQCDYCHKSLCLTHRSYQAHNCDGAASKDITSMDCPICGKSVSFTKIQNPNLVWEDHYNNTCTKDSKNLTKTANKCIASSCRTLLGLSNTFNCPKCKRNVCLSHRIPEEHQCSSLTKQNQFLSKIESNMKSGTKSNNVKINNSSSATNTKKINDTKLKIVDNTNTLKGTIERRKQQSNNSDTFYNNNINNEESKTSGSKLSQEDLIQCPFCQFKDLDSNIMFSHIESLHPNPTAGTTSSPPTPIHTPSQTMSLAREVCPVCQARFVDPIDLVQHFETAHGNNSNSLANQKETCTIW